MNQEIKTYENESYRVEASEEPHCLLSLKIEVKPNATKKAYKKAVKTVNKQISIPGFRKGKAPDQAVITRYSSYVDQEWKELVIGEAYQAALELTQVYPVSKSAIRKPKLESISQEEGAIIHLSYEHFPSVPEIDLSSISLPAIHPESVEEKQIEDVLDQVRRSFATWEPVEGKVVEEKDWVDISIYSLDENPPKSILQDRRIEVAANNTPSWLTNLLLGMEPGQTKEGKSELDADADEKMKEGFIPTNVRVELHSIQKSVLPELDDELIKKIGAESLDDLKGKIRRNLEKEAEESANQKRIEALDNALLEKYVFDIPFSLIESEKESRLSEREKYFEHSKLSDEEIAIKLEEFEQECERDIPRALRLYFLNKQIEKQGRISLSKEELNEEIVKQIQQNPYLYSKDNEGETKDIVSQMIASMMRKKAREYALSQVQSIEVQ